MMPEDDIRAHNSARYDAGFRRLLEGRGVPAYALAVWKNGRMVYRLSGGSHYPESGTGTIHENTRFNVGSVSKPVTAAALMLLLEEGRLCLDDPVAKHIPEYPHPQVTLLHLLTHSAGYAAATGSDFGVPALASEVPAFLSRIYQVRELAYETGTASAYFTLGYCILMDVIERVSGMTFETFVRRRLFDPLGMSSSTFDPGRLGEPSTYVLPWDGSRNDYLREEAMTAVMGDRGLYTTADDLVRFGRVFLNGGFPSLLSPAARDRAAAELAGFSPSKTPAFWRKGSRDGYGCFGDTCSPDALGHTGFTGCMLLIDPTYDTVAAMLTNSVGWHADWRNYKRLCNLVMALPTSKNSCRK